MRRVVGCCEERAALLVLAFSRDAEEDDASADREFCKGAPLAIAGALDVTTALDELAADLEFCIGIPTSPPDAAAFCVDEGGFKVT